MRITPNLHAPYVGEMHRFGDKAVGTYSNEWGEWSDLLSGKKDRIVHWIRCGWASELVWTLWEMKY